MDLSQSERAELVFGGLTVCMQTRNESLFEASVRQQDDNRLKLWTELPGATMLVKASLLARSQKK